MNGQYQKMTPNEPYRYKYFDGQIISSVQSDGRISSCQILINKLKHMFYSILNSIFS